MPRWVGMPSGRGEPNECRMSCEGPFSLKDEVCPRGGMDDVTMVELYEAQVRGDGSHLA